MTLFLRALVILSVICSSLFLSASANEVLSSLHHDIKTAEARLNKTQARLAKEQQQLSTALQRAEQDVAKLRKESEGLIRAQDEAALSIEQVESRLQEWQQQGQFQQHLFTRFLSGQKHPTNDNKLSALMAATKNVIAQSTQLNGRFYPQSVTLQNGQAIAAELVNIGPFTYFFSEQLSGLIDRQSEHNEVALVFEPTQLDAIKQLKSTGEATLAIDPSNGRALTRQQEQETTLAHIEKGGVWAAPIILFAFFALTIALYKLIQLSRLPKLVPALSERLVLLKDDVSHLKLGCWQQQLVDICKHTPIGQLRDDKLFNALNEQKKQLDNLLGAIAVTAAVAPLLGLLGTVSGMIETFKLMTLFGAGDPAAVSGGISEALVTTELGLVVAIPALLSHAFLSRKVKSYYHQLEQSAIALSQHSFEPLLSVANENLNTENKGAA